jgi:hypothetical protein
MDVEQAKQGLRAFLQGRELTFSVRTFESGEWIAECNEIPAITTGGMGYDDRDALMRDAIVSAAGVPGDYGYLLDFKGFKVPPSFFGFTTISGAAEAPRYVVQS